MIGEMTTPSKRPKLASVGTALTEIAFIIFLFYANLLMGEFTRSSTPGKTFTAALYDILDARTFGIALAAASIGFVGFDYLRKRL
jgi:hypothetical protein